MPFTLNTQPSKSVPMPTCCAPATLAPCTMESAIASMESPPSRSFQVITPIRPPVRAISLDRGEAAEPGVRREDRPGDGPEHVGERPIGTVGHVHQDSQLFAAADQGAA